MLLLPGFPVSGLQSKGVMKALKQEMILREHWEFVPFVICNNLNCLVNFLETIMKSSGEMVHLGKKMLRTMELS